MFESFRHVLIALIPYTLVLIVMRILGYIDASVVFRIYLPIFLLGMSPLIFGKHCIGYAFLAFASMGLIAEYIVHSMNPDEPSMAPAMANAMFLLSGIVVGAGVQFVADQRRKRRKP